jgi:uncharacterized tellurite resistance protein B-like protein
MRDFLRLNVDAVVSTWGDFTPTADEMQAILEVAYLAIASDGVVSRSEVEAFAMVMERLFGPKLTAEHIEEVLDKNEDDLDKSGFRRRLENVASRLTRREARDKAYQLSYAMVMCDLDTNIHEFEFDQVLRQMLGLDEEAAESLVDGVVDLVIVPQTAPSKK